ncbi:MAG: hypothetical protein OSB41_01615 [Kiritimatiellae bacterium]|nr:hypothetical protein [Kiritimatiellia bacterium]
MFKHISNPVAKRMLGALLLLTALYIPSSTLALDRAELLPKETTFTVRVANMSEMVSALTNAPVAQMWQAKAFQDFVGNVDLREAYLEQETLNMGNREAAELQLEELGMLAGEVIVGIIATDADTISYKAVAHLTEDDYLKSLDMDRRIDELGKNEITFINHDFQGEQIVESRRVGKDSEVPEISFQSHMGETLVLSDDREWVEATLLKLRDMEPDEPEGETPGLTINVDAQALVGVLQTAFDNAFANNAPQGDAGAAPKAQPGVLMEALGLHQLGNALFSFELHNDKLIFKSNVLVGNDLKGLLSVLDVRPVDAITPLPYVQDDLFLAMHSRYDIASLWNEVPNIMRKVVPGSEMMLGMVVMSMGGTDPGRDVFAHLDTTYSRIGRLKAGVPEELLLWRVNNADALRQTLDAAMAEGKPLRTQLGETLDVDAFRDRTIYTFPDQSTGRRSGVAVTEEHLLVGSAEMIRASIQSLDQSGTKNPFMSSTTYNRLLRLAPRQSFAVGIVDWKRLVDHALNNTADGENGLPVFKQLQMAAQNAEGFKDSIWANINWNKFPQAQFFARHLGPSLTFSEAKNGTLESQFIVYYPESR